MNSPIASPWKASLISMPIPIEISSSSADLWEVTPKASNEAIAILVMLEHGHKIAYMLPRSVHPQAIDPNLPEDGLKP